MVSALVSPPATDDATVVLKPGRGSQPEIRRERLDEVWTIVKDYRHQRGWRRRLAGWTLAREARAYQLLRDFSGVPKYLGREGHRALRLTFIEGKPCGAFEDEGLGDLLPPEFFARVEQVVRDLHARGVAHNDLKRARNIIVTPDFQPVLIDFAAAVWSAPRWNPVRRWLFRQICEVDLNAVAKLKRRFAPQLVTAEDQRRLDYPTLLERLARRVLNR